MRPIAFVCTETLPLVPAAIAGRILDVAHWTDFQGFAFIPGIRTADFEVRTPAVVGSRIRVTNTDGSRHVEEIAEWQPERRVRLDMKDFAPPLSRLAAGFEEVWEFERIGDATRVTRAFRLHPKSALA